MVNDVLLQGPGSEAWMPLLTQVLLGVGVNLVFQPIVDLQRGAVVGYESLARFTGPTGLTPDRWFAAAASRGLVADLDAMVLKAVLQRRRDLPANCFLTVNLEPESLLADCVTEVFETAGSLRGLVVEITEHRPMVDTEATERSLSRLKAKGAMVALDDAGAGYAGLQQILFLRPSFLKVDRALIDGIDRDEAKVSLVEMLGVFASRVDAWLVAEGVETESEARRLAALGIPLSQGYFFGRPSPPWSGLQPTAVAALTANEKSRSTTLHELVDPAPWVSHETIASASPRLLSGEVAFYAVLDGERRPLGVLTPEAARRGVMETPLVTNVHATPRELAHRLATRRPVDTATPVLVTDNAGRYLGVVGVARLLTALASG